MAAGLNGTFVIRVVQTEIDGIPGRAESFLPVGSSWRWSGEAIRVDAPGDLLLLGEPYEHVQLKRRAGRRVRSFLNDCLPAPTQSSLDLLEEGAEGGFVVTDGRQTFAAALINASEPDQALVVFAGRMPPRDVDLWVVEARAVKVQKAAIPDAMVCFTPGVMVATPKGLRAIECLRPGDRVETLDDGPQPVIWTGFSDIGAATLAEDVDALPIRIPPGAFGPDSPGDGLVLSPDHRILLSGYAARDLFNSAEVLVAARDLAQGRRLKPRKSLRYHHLMFERHQIIWAGGIPCESFHPSDAHLPSLKDAQRLSLIDSAPDVYRDPLSFGDHARRCLNAAEAVILHAG